MYVRHADPEITVAKKAVYAHRSLEAGGTKATLGPPGPPMEVPGLVRGQRDRGKTREGAFTVVSQKE